MPTVAASDGVAVNYQVQGHGPATILFMHGWAGSGAYFDEVVGELDLNALRVVGMDFRGHGGSDKAVPAYGLQTIASDAWAVADAAGARRVVLVGFSMSGKFAQYVAACQPDRVAGLVLVAGFQASEIPFPEEVIRDWVSRAGDRERIRELLQPFISEPVETPVLDAFLDDAVKVPAAVLDCTLRTCVRSSFSERVGILQMPTLVIGGRRDAYFPPEAVSQLARSLPCGRGIVVDCNHEVAMERPRELAHIIEAFVAGLGISCRT